MLVGQYEQKTIQSFEATLYLLLGDNGFNAVYRGGMTLCRKLRAVLPMSPFEFEVAIIEGIDQGAPRILMGTP